MACCLAERRLFVAPHLPLSPAPHLDVSHPMQEPIRPPRNLVPIAVAVEGGLGVAAWVVAWLCGLDLLGMVWWDTRHAAWGVLATLPMLLGIWLPLKLNWGPFVRLREVVDQWILPMFAGCRWYHLLPICVAAGLGEELMFRGLIQAGLAEWSGGTGGIVIGLVVGSLLFGLAHPITNTYIFLAAALGLYLGALLLVFENLLVPIIAHALYDLIALVYLVGRGESSELPVASSE